MVIWNGIIPCQLQLKLLLEIDLYKVNGLNQPMTSNCLAAAEATERLVGTKFSISETETWNNSISVFQ